MPTTSDAKATPGTGINFATYSITEDSETKQVGRAVLSTNTGVDLGTSATPLQVSLANTATNSVPVKTDNSGVTQPISASTLPLPAGAATSARQPALGTAGAAATDVLSVQGISSGTPLAVSGTVTANAGTNMSTAALALESGGNLQTLASTVVSSKVKVDGSGVTQPVSGTVTANIGTTNGVALDTSVNGVLIAQGSTTSGETGPLIQGAVTTASPSYTTAKTNPLSLTTAGALRVDASATTQPVSAASLPLPTGAALEAGNLSTLAGAVTSSVLQENVKQINGVVPLMGNGTTGTGSQRVTIASDNTAFSVNAVESGTWTVQPGNTANTTPWLATPTPATTGGYTTYHLVSAGSTNATSVKGSAGQLYGWYIYNSNSSARKLAFHNTSGTPTAGASIFFTIVVPPLAAANVFATSGIAFSSGIGISTVTGLADTDATAVASQDLIINLFYF